ncbi:MAG TPA: DUF4124 domain-containing protein [Rubrivivax sp.]|nr:DUF4124 domain-containing protein [Burkholderiales bacterium]HNT39965.1 DUF4124 domain-containing protein [Rubrivivax sp.]
MKMLALVILAAPIAAHAVYQCKGADGRVSYQERPCAAEQTQSTVRIHQTAGDAAAGPTVEQRMLAGMQHERRVQALAQSVAEIEAGIDERNARMDRELQALRQSKSRARNNLAGAAWEQSISTEMAAVAAKYKAQNETDLERLRVLRKRLDEERGQR